MWKRITSVGQLGRPYSQLQTTTAIGPNRAFHSTPGIQTPPGKQKEYNRQQDFDRTVLNPERSEGTRSGTDSEVAKHGSAYDPTKTSPESEIQATEEESEREGKPSNPLGVSGANKDVSNARDPQDEGADRNADKDAVSGRGVTRKHRRVNTGGS